MNENDFYLSSMVAAQQSPTWKAFPRSPPVGPEMELAVLLLEPASSLRGGLRELQKPELLWSLTLQASFSPLWRVLIGEEKNQAFLTRPLPKKMMGGQDEKKWVPVVLLFESPPTASHWRGWLGMISWVTDGTWRLTWGQCAFFPKESGPGTYGRSHYNFEKNGSSKELKINLLSHDLNSYFSWLLGD